MSYLRSLALCSAMLVAWPAEAQAIRYVTPAERLLPSHYTNNRELGRASAIDGDHAATSSALSTTIGSGFRQEAVFVFERDASGQWVENGVLLHPTQPQVTTDYGVCIALDGDTLAVGAPLETTAPGAGLGGVFVYRRSGTPGTWQLVATLLAPAGTDRFGSSLDLSGDTLIVGAPERTTTLSNAIYAFERDLGGPEAWGLAQTITVPAGSKHRSFGDALAIDGDTLVATRTRLILLDQYELALHVFERTRAAGPWQETSTLPGFHFQTFARGAFFPIDPRSIALSGSYLASLGSDTPGEAVRLFERDVAGGWSQVQGLASGGSSLALAGDRLFVACPSCFSVYGKVTRYDRLPGSSGFWARTLTYLRPLSTGSPTFGTSVAASARRVLIGASAVPGEAYLLDHEPRSTFLAAPSPIAAR